MGAICTEHGTTAVLFEDITVCCKAFFITDCCISMIIALFIKYNQQKWHGHNFCLIRLILDHHLAVARQMLKNILYKCIMY